MVNFVANNSDDEPTWIIDSGATFHGVKDANLLQNIVPCKTYFDGFFGEISVAKHVGDACLSVISPTNETISLDGVLHIPDLAYNVISVSRLTTDSPTLMVEFNSSGFFVKNFMTNELLAWGKKFGNYYFWPRPNDVFHRHRPKPDIKITVRSLMTALRNVFWGNLSNLVALCADGFAKLVYTRTNPSKGENCDGLWILDSGSPIHIASNVALLEDHCPSAVKVYWGDLVGSTHAATHVGNTYLGGPNHGMMLHSVQIVEGAKDNLISVAALTSKNSCSVKFFSSGFALKSLEDDKIVATGIKFNNYYYLSDKSFQIFGTKQK